MWHLLTAHQQESSHLFSSRPSLSCRLSHVAKGSTPKPQGPNSNPSCVVLHGMAATPGFKSLGQSFPAAPFLTPPIISYTCQHSGILPALLGCQSKSGQACPHGVEPVQSSPSSHAGAVTRGSCFPVTSWVEVTSIPLAQSMATTI